MGVMLQTFYWDCPADEGREGRWWSRQGRHLLPWAFVHQGRSQTHVRFLQTGLQWRASICLNPGAQSLAPDEGAAIQFATVECRQKIVTGHRADVLVADNVVPIIVCGRVLLG